MVWEGWSVKCCVLTCHWFSSLFEDRDSNQGREQTLSGPFLSKTGRTGATWGWLAGSREWGEGKRVCSSDEAPSAVGSVPLLPCYFGAILKSKSASPILKLLSLSSGSPSYTLPFQKLPSSSHLQLQTGSSHLPSFPSPVVWASFTTVVQDRKGTLLSLSCIPSILKTLSSQVLLIPFLYHYSFYSPSRSPCTKRTQFHFLNKS